MQVSSVPTVVQYTPVQPVRPVAPVKRDETDDGDKATQKPSAANPPGVGTLLDIRA